MGMYLELVSVSDATIARLHDDPPLVWRIIAPDDPRALAPSPPGLFARLFGRKKAETTPDLGPTLELSEGEGEVGDLDKAWHGIHYLLTGTAWEGHPPLNFLVAGGREVGADEVGIGPPRTFSSGETRVITDALARIADEELRGRFLPADMMRLEIYPEIWDRDSAEDDTLGYLMEYVANLRGALATVVSRGHGLLLSIS
ncbi:MAG: YfbM family protein [Gemmataceae bacterium]|nr:YfbM family protein [Gemmataceae bacterium]